MLLIDFEDFYNTHINAAFGFLSVQIRQNLGPKKKRNNQTPDSSSQFVCVFFACVSCHVISSSTLKQYVLRLYGKMYIPQFSGSGTFSHN